jgi:two-component sensor histidine kinase
VLVVSELVTNAVIHAQTSFGLLLAVVGDHLRVVVRDEDPGRLVQRAHDDHALSGRGLFIVEALASQWGVDDGADGKATWARIRLPAIPDEASRDAVTVATPRPAHATATIPSQTPPSK